ncbi:hypothetical protein Zmor_019073, partial [Zophobas morio]
SHTSTGTLKAKEQLNHTRGETLLAGRKWLCPSYRDVVAETVMVEADWPKARQLLVSTSMVPLDVGDSDQKETSGWGIKNCKILIRIFLDEKVENWF